VRFSLSARLLVLTMGFVMLAEVLIFAPSVSQFRVDYLHDKLDQAHLVLTALEAAGGSIDPALRDRLLDQADMLGMTLNRSGRPPLTLAPRIPPQIPTEYDLRDAPIWELVIDAIAVLWRSGNPVFSVIDYSDSNRALTLEAVLQEAPLRAEMHAYAIQVFGISVFISMTTAALVYASIQWLAVHPLRKITDSMTAFRQAPEDETRVIAPSTRRDEVGVAERTLAEMQNQLRQALTQRERLAAVGAAVTKVSHDLKNILATAMLESERLAASGDDDTRRITAGIVRAIDRAVAMSKSTLKFAQEGLPQVHRRRQSLAPVLREVVATLTPLLPNCAILLDVDDAVRVSIDPDLLQRALENLVRNAAEAGAREVRLVWSAESTPTLAVIDNGPGLSKRAIENLFMPFAGSARSGGSGLGLPIARESLRAQGGDVDLAATGASGTTFLVRLPA
jgi:signal transduction histidine kinase